jgi:hypothetical protein
MKTYSSSLPALSLIKIAPSFLALAYHQNCDHIVSEGERDIRGNAPG